MSRYIAFKFSHIKNLLGFEVYKANKNLVGLLHHQKINMGSQDVWKWERGNGVFSVF